MKKLNLFAIGLFTAALTFGASSCNSNEKRSDGTPDYQKRTYQRTETESYPSQSYNQTRANYSENYYGVKSDNSEMNERITKNSEWTAEDQGSSDSDIQMTQEIRREVVDQDQFSSNAKNIKVITRDGQVVLKGPVRTMSEKMRIESIAKRVAGNTRVISAITVTK